MLPERRHDGHGAASGLIGNDVSLSFRLANDVDIPALLKIRLAVEAHQALRFGKNRWSTAISEKSVARGL